MDHRPNPASRQTTTTPRPADPSPGTMQIARSWPRPVRVRTTYIISMYKFISSLASSSPSLALDAIAKDLKISNSVARVLPLSIYLLGYAIGPLLIAPLADTFGRIRLLQASSVVFVVSNLVAGFANDNATMLAMRLLSGIGGSGPITVRILLSLCLNPKSTILTLVSAWCFHSVGLLDQGRAAADDDYIHSTSTDRPGSRPDSWGICNNASFMALDVLDCISDEPIYTAARSGFPVGDAHPTLSVYGRGSQQGLDQTDG